MDKHSPRFKSVASVVAYFSILFAATYFILFWQINAQERRIVDQVKQEEFSDASKLLDVFSRHINSRLNTLSQMTFLLSDGELLRQFLEQPKEDSLLLLSDAFRNLLLLELDIESIHLVDLQGKGLLHMKQKGILGSSILETPEDISSELYFHELKMLSMSSVGRYLGGFEKTMLNSLDYRNLALRLVAPVYDGYLPMGYVVVSLAFNKFLRSSLVELGAEHANFMLLNHSGHYLYGVRDDWLFGHELTSRSAYSFQADYPDIWRKVNVDGHDNAVETTQDTHFVFKTLELDLGRDETYETWSLTYFTNKQIDEMTSQELVYFKRWGVLIVLVAFIVAVLGSWMRVRRSKFVELSYMAQATMRSMSPIILIDEFGRVKKINKQFSMILGYGSADIIGITFWNFSDDRNQKVMHDVWDQLQVHGSWEGEVTLFSKEGRKIEGLCHFFSLESNSRKVKGYVGSLVDISAQKALESRLRDLTITDALTGCKNRRFFDNALTNQVENLKRNPRQIFCLGIIDIDYFKRVNDEYGHDVGDEVLQFFVHVVEQEIRAFDLMCRVGGEEFAIILPNTEIEDACLVLERVRLAVASADIQPAITCSVGLIQSELDREPDDLYRWADEMLYRAKQGGRNRVTSCRS